MQIQMQMQVQVQVQVPVLGQAFVALPEYLRVPAYPGHLIGCIQTVRRIASGE